MGTDFNCGCRTSGGAWYPCKKHEADLIAGVKPVFDQEVTKKEILGKLEEIKIIVNNLWDEQEK